MWIASYGQACRHALQPMHTRLSNSTMPSWRWYMAVTGQMRTQGGFAQWLQRVTWKCRRASAPEPVSTYLTHVRYTPRGTSFSLLHAVEQAWQPMQARLSITNPKFISPPQSAAVDGHAPRAHGATLPQHASGLHGTALAASGHSRDTHPPSNCHQRPL